MGRSSSPPRPIGPGIGPSAPQLPMPFEGGMPQTPYKNSSPVYRPGLGQRGGFNPGQPVPGQMGGGIGPRVPQSVMSGLLRGQVY